MAESTSSDKPSYEELSEENTSLRATVAEQAALIEKLSVEIAELRARLDMNSRNSSKPPSSDLHRRVGPREHSFDTRQSAFHPGEWWLLKTP